MSNRRFLKVLHELAGLPKERAAKLIKKEIKETLPVYESLFLKDLKALTPFLKPDSKPSGFPGFTITMNPDRSLAEPSLPGTRYKVLALVLIAQHLRLKECYSEVAKVAQRGRTQYRELSQKDKYNESLAYFLLGGGSLYNRQILGSGLLGTAPDNKKAQAIINRFQNKWQSKDLPNYDALASPYDFHGALTVDFSKGRISLRYLAPLADAAFEEIMEGLELK